MKPVIVIHGGAGVILPQHLPRELELEYRSGLDRALRAGYAFLEQGGNALDAVEAAVIDMENNPLFNAACGSVFTFEGQCEMDAAIMDGARHRAGAIAGVRGIKNPVILSRLVMEKSDHVILAGKGAEEFARANEVAFEKEEYFFTERRREQWVRAQEANRTSLDHSGDDEKKFGTVGAVALDAHGQLASATSTGGMTNKRWGRIGDSPIIGAGTWADNAVAVSCTGHGEFFIRRVVAYEISALMRYKGLTLAEACEEVIMRQLPMDGGEGGLIAVDSHGNIALPFNTPGMYRGFMDAPDHCMTAVFRES